MSAHPFSQYIRILGRGKKSTRSLSFEEAQDAMQLILSGKVEPEQIGAFLMLLRVKEESPQEVAGFVSSIRTFLNAPAQELNVDLDWSSYSGKRKQAPWFLLAVFALANSGVRILMHGSAGHTENRIYTSHMLKALGFDAADTWELAQQQLDKSSFGYINLDTLSPELERLIHLKPLLGLRSPINTLVRLLNPCAAKHSISSVFHPAYANIQTQAQQLLQQKSFCVFKGEGGEIEARPEADSKVTSLQSETISDQKWLRLSDQKPDITAALDLEICRETLQNVWRQTDSEYDNSYALNSIHQTLAISVSLLNPELSQTQCYERANIIWQQRQLDFL